MMRLMVVIPLYAFVVILLPQQSWFVAVTDPLRRIDPDLAFAASLVSLVVSGFGIWLLRGQKPPVWVFRHPRLAQIAASGFFGLFIAAVFDIFQKLSGYATDVISIILIPIAFMIAEGVFLAFEWRINRKSD